MRLQESLGTCRTFSNVREGETMIDPFPAIEVRDPSAILTFKFPDRGKYEENIEELPVI